MAAAVPESASTEADRMTTADGLRAELDSAGQMLLVHNHPQAELHLRRYVAAGGTDPVAHNLMAVVARGYGLNPDFRLSEVRPRPGSGAPRYLVIKAWGYGFWSDVHHVMGQLLLAELTHRIPVIHWGSNSLFRDAAAYARGSTLRNAFDLYFEPVSAVGLADLPANASVYPPKWSRDTLHLENVNKWEGPGSRLAAPYLFDRPEDVVVSDFYTTLDTLIPWIGTDSRYHGLADDEIYNDLFARYCRPLPALAARVDAFHGAHLGGRAFAAVHVRGSDKVYESAGLHQTNLRYFGFVDRIVELNPGIGVFLLTDSVDVHAEFTARYGDRVVATPALRTNGTLGVHMLGHDGRLVAEEVILDAFLAARCAYFVGNQESNVSLAISSLKRWPKGFLALLGEKNGRTENMFLHRRPAAPPEPVETCRLCRSPVRRLFDLEVLGEHRVGYHHCMGCGALQTDRPHWLEQAYSAKCERFDTGKASRTLVNFLAFPKLLDILQVRGADRAVDFGGGTGLFARLMRDLGYDFHCCDKYGSAEFMAGYAWNEIDHRCKLVTIFEVAEHFAEPASEWERIFASDPDFIIGSTGLYNEHSARQAGAWPYLVPETGQHVFFYSSESLSYLARRHGRHAYQMGMYFILSRQVLSPAVLDELGRWRDQLMPACQSTFQRWAQGPYMHATRDNQDMLAWSQLEQRGARIAIDGVFFRFQSGIARVWRSLLAEWAGNGFADHLVVIDRGRTAPRHAGIRYVDLPHPDPRDPAGERVRLQQICDAERVSLFISTYYSTPLSTPTALLVLDMIPEVVGYDLADPQWVAKREAIEYARAFISISHSTQRDLERLYPIAAEAPKVVAHCGCDFRPATPDQVAIFKARFDITRPYFMISGGRSDYKNAALFFKAFAGLGERRGEFAIVCTNANRALEPEFAAHVGDAQVHMVALTDEALRCAYTGALALAYPSRYEGFGLPVAEAMACGCPVITCANSSLPEVGGQAVIYVDPDDVDAMRAALIAVQEPGRRADLVARGFEQAQQFSWSAMARTIARSLAQWACRPPQRAVRSLTPGHADPAVSVDVGTEPALPA